MDNQIDAKKDLIEILDFYKFKIQSGGCTMAEINATLHALEENMDIDGTVSDFAKFYGVPEQYVRNNINRKLIAKPKRKLLYPFHLFRKIIPDSWRNRDQ